MALSIDFKRVNLAKIMSFDSERRKPTALFENFFWSVFWQDFFTNTFQV
jgi:hypothetical protein